MSFFALLAHLFAARRNTRSRRWSRSLLALLLTSVITGYSGLETTHAATTYTLNSSSWTEFYDAEGNQLDLMLHSVTRDNKTVILGINVVLNGEYRGYAPPVILPGQTSIDHWSARGATVRLENEAYVIHSEELGQWFHDKIRYTDPSTPAVPASTAR